MKRRPLCLHCGARIRRGWRRWKWFEKDDTLRPRMYMATLKPDSGAHMGSKWGNIVSWREGWGFKGFNLFCDKDCCYAWVSTTVSPKWGEFKR